MLPQWVRGRTTAWNQRVGWSIPSSRRPAPLQPKAHCTQHVLSKQTISIDARADATQTLELAPLIEVSDAALSVMLVVRLHDVGAMEQSASCTLTLRHASVTVDGTVLRGEALCWVAFDAQADTPVLLTAHTEMPVADMALTLEWSQGTSTSSAQDIVLSVDVVERRAPVRTAVPPSRATTATPARRRSGPRCDEAAPSASVISMRRRAAAMLHAARRPAATAMGGAGAEVSYRVLDKRTFDIDGDTRELAVPLATRIPTVDYIDAVLVVRVHALTWPTEGTPTLSVRLLNESVAPEQPSLEFVERDDVVASVDIDDSLATPALLLAEASRVVGIGDHLRVELAWSSTSIYPASVTLGIDLVMRERRRPFAPTDLEDCMVWLRADRGLSVSDGEVTDWADARGNGNAFTRVDVSKQPVYVASDPSFNDRPTVNFDTAGGSMVNSSLDSGGAVNITVLCVVSFEEVSSVRNYLVDFTGVDRTVFASPGFAAVADDVAYYDGSWRDSGATSTAEAQILAFVVDASTVAFHRNGTLLGSTSSAGARHLQHPVYLPKRHTWQSAGDGDRLAELIVYQRALDDDELTRVTSYLKRKYAL